MEHKKVKEMEVNYQPHQSMYERHPQHHLACLKFHHFLCPYGFNTQYFRNTNLTTVYTTKEETRTCLFINT